jgi:hypothetical protein
MLAWLLPYPMQQPIYTMRSLLYSPQLWAKTHLLLAAQVRCPVQLSRSLEFLVQQLTALMS